MKDINEIYMNTLVPMVVEQSARGERAYDIFSRLCSSVAVLRSRKPQKGDLHVHQLTWRSGVIWPVYI